MPPPNQQTGSPPSGSAASMRTFMWTIGTYGLRGWNTSDTPIASKGAPDSSGRFCVAEGGSLGPRTCEKPQPARSNSSPPSRMQVSPWPCSGSPGAFCQASRTQVPPSACSTAATIDCCSARR
jgi:hypothetical protein